MYYDGDDRRWRPGHIYELRFCPDSKSSRQPDRPAWSSWDERFNRDGQRRYLTDHATGHAYHPSRGFFHRVRYGASWGNGHGVYQLQFKWDCEPYRRTQRVGNACRTWRGCRRFYQRRIVPLYGPPSHFGGGHWL